MSSSSENHSRGNNAANTNASQTNDDREQHDEVVESLEPPSLLQISCSTRSVFLIFLCRVIRMFLFGGCGVIFLLFLADDELRFSTVETTASLVCVYVGDWIISLFLSSRADKFGRRLTLAVAAILLAGLGICYYFTTHVAAVIVVGFIGIVSPSGGELGPFVSIEQSALADILSHYFTTYYSKDPQVKQYLPSALTSLVSWYQLFGSLSQAVGAVGVGYIANRLITDDGFSNSHAYQTLFVGYAVAGGILFVIYCLLPVDVEMVHAPPSHDSTRQQQQQYHTMVGTSEHNHDEDNDEESSCCYGLLKHFGLFRRKTQKNVLLFSSLFFWDAFGGALIMQSYIAWYFHKRWALDLHNLGWLFFGVNVLAAISGLVAGWLVKKIGAIKTMVFTHAPSNVMLALIVFMPNEYWAMGLLLARYSISQMDVPARQAYVAMTTPKDEKSAANGITNSVRSLAVALGALALIPMLKAEQHSDKIFWNSVPFVAAGGLKLLYDFAVYIMFTRATGEVGQMEQKKTNHNNNENEKAPLIQSKN